MTKRGIDELSFNDVAVSNLTSEIADNALTNNSIDSFEIVNGTADYLIDSNGTSNGNSSGANNSNEDITSSNKKFKGDGSVPASAKSRVVHIRNIPMDTTAKDLINLASPFGTITQHLFIRSKNQAFVEFESHFSAQQMASYWIQTTIGGIPSQVQPMIRGRNVHVQVSNHKELSLHFKNSNNTSTNGSNNTPNNTNLMNKNQWILDCYSNDNYSDNQHSSAGTSLTPSPVIRVIIENQMYTVSVDILYQLFSRCGTVLKIIMFNKNHQVQALIQFSDITGSIQAKTNFDGQSAFQGVTPGFNLMKIEYSKLQNINVKYNNNKSRDYTILPQNGTSLNGSFANTTYLNHHPESDISSSILNSTLGIPNAAAAASFNPLTSAAMNLNGHANSNSSLAALNSRYLALTNVLPTTNLNSFINHTNAAAAAAVFAGIPTNFVLTPVVHVSGLNPEHITPDALFTLFGVYGDVIRVKILFNKKDTALIQMAEPTQAQNAISYLDRTKLFGKTIHVMSSKHPSVQMPKEGHQDSGLTKDYTNSPLHRFKRPGSKNYNNIYPPSETLHVSNIPSNCTEDDLRKAFQQATGKEIAKFKFFPNDHRMALVQFKSIEDAVLALIEMHNYKVAEHSHLRVSFSKSPV